MKIRTLYFGKFGDLLGSTGENLDLPAGSGLEQLRRRLVERGEAWQILLDASTCCAVNQHIEKEDCPLHEGDEVAFFPPVTGG